MDTKSFRATSITALSNKIESFISSGVVSVEALSIVPEGAGFAAIIIFTS